MGFRWQTTAVVFCITFLILALGYQIYERYGVQLPVEKRVLATGVVSRIEWVSPGRELKVYLNPVADLSEAYAGLEQAAGSGIAVILADTATPELESVYRKAEPALYEAAALSDFIFMAAKVDEVAAEASLDQWSVRLDEKRIYLQLSDEGAYLYRVIPRQEQQEA